jgi:hypothetical protein
MPKVAINKMVGSKVVSGVVDPVTLETLPCIATDNGDGTATLKVDSELTATIDASGLATGAKQDTGNTSLATVASILDGVDVASISITTGFKLASSTVEITRPADTTAYTAGDRVGPASGSLPAQLTGCALANGRGGVITMIRLSTDKKSITPRIRCHFFNASNATLSADNAAYQEKYADGTKRVGFVDLDSMATATDTTNSDCSRSQNYEVRLPYVCAADSTSLWIAYEALDAFTPASGEKFSIVIKTEQG